MQQYAGGRSYGVRLRKPLKIHAIEKKRPHYSTITREGNEAFPVDGIIRNRRNNLLDTNINDDCQSMEEASKPIQKVKKFKND